MLIPGKEALIVAFMQMIKCAHHVSHVFIFAPGHDMNPDTLKRYQCNHLCVVPELSEEDGDYGLDPASALGSGTAQPASPIASAVRKMCRLR